MTAREQEKSSQPGPERTQLSHPETLMLRPQRDTLHRPGRQPVFPTQLPSLRSRRPQPTWERPPCLQRRRKSPPFSHPPTGFPASEKRQRPGPTVGLAFQRSLLRGAQAPSVAEATAQERPGVSPASWPSHAARPSLMRGGGDESTSPHIWAPSPRLRERRGESLTWWQPQLGSPTQQGQGQSHNENEKPLTGPESAETGLINNKAGSISSQLIKHEEMLPNPSVKEFRVPQFPLSLPRSVLYSPRKGAQPGSPAREHRSAGTTHSLTQDLCAEV